MTLFDRPHRNKLIASWLTGTVLLLGTPGLAGEPCETCQRNEGHARAGCPLCLSLFAIPSNTRFYEGYYVGGGTIFRGDLRNRGEGTWGWDYGGIFVPKRVALNWSHGRRYQGSTGAYRTAGFAPFRAQ
jgi:hypothetical protein